MDVHLFIYFFFFNLKSHILKFSPKAQINVPFVYHVNRV